MTAPVSRIFRVFVAHPKSLPDEEVPQLAEDVRRAATGFKLRDGSVAAPVVTTARDYFKEWSDKYGFPINWAAYTESVVGYVTAFSRDPKFHMLVIGPTGVVGAATARMYEVGRTRPWFYLNTEKKLVRIVGINRVQDMNQKTGWVVVPA